MYCNYRMYVPYSATSISKLAGSFYCTVLQLTKFFHYELYLLAVDISPLPVCSPSAILLTVWPSSLHHVPRYGTVRDYLTSTGFTADEQQKLRNVFLATDSG